MAVPRPRRLTAQRFAAIKSAAAKPVPGLADRLEVDSAITMIVIGPVVGATEGGAGFRDLALPSKERSNLAKDAERRDWRRPVPAISWSSRYRTSAQIAVLGREGACRPPC
jgi:hypothetical protein